MLTQVRIRQENLGQPIFQRFAIEASDLGLAVGYYPTYFIVETPEGQFGVSATDFYRDGGRVYTSVDGRTEIVVLND